MCGFIGLNRRVDSPVIKTISSAMTHRGPDGYGDYVSDGMTMAHRRLSIIDLEGGRQPISNENNTLWIVFNGEMYNYQEQRELLLGKGHSFKTKSDTEVILHLYEEFGPDALHRINGEFAIAIWNEGRQELFLARDRFGIKPLYYHFENNVLAFASEIKAILKVPGLNKRLNLDHVAHYFNFRFSSGEESLFSGIRRLPPGSYATYRDGRLTVKTYYNFSFCSEPKANLSYGEITEQLRELLSSSVKYRLIADVDVGIFLSSGIDSTSVLSLASNFKQRMKAFTIGFGFKSDEIEKAGKIAERCGAEFFPAMIDSSPFSLLSEIVERFDEPIGDSIIIPTYLLAHQASRHVKAVLTGEGADEVFGGYIHHLTFFYLEKYLRHVPKVFLHFISGLVRQMPLTVLNMLFPYPERLQENDRRKIAAFFSFANDFYATRRSMIYLFDRNEFSLGELKEASDWCAPSNGDPSGSFFLREIDTDMRSWLAYYTLYKQDTLTMANSLEGRVPFLDHRLVEFLTTLPENQFVRNANVKMPLRRAMSGILPGEIIKARKRAFYFPYHRFFDRSFKDQMLAVHHESKTDSDLSQIINFDYFERLIERYQEGMSLLGSKRLMVYIVFLLWYRRHFAHA